MLFHGRIAHFWVIFHCLDGTQLIHHLRKEVWLLPGFSNHKQSCCKLLCAGFLAVVVVCLFYWSKFSAYWVMISFFLFKSSRDAFLKSEREGGKREERGRNIDVRDHIDWLPPTPWPGLGVNSQSRYLPLTRNWIQEPAVCVGWHSNHLATLAKVSFHFLFYLFI